MPNNPERPSQANEIPAEWKSLINDEVLDLEGKPTDEYLNSQAGRKALEEEQKLYRHAEMIDRRIAEYDRILASGSSTADERARAKEYRQKYLDLKDKLLDKTINAIDAYRQDYAGRRSREDFEALWRKLEYMERGEKANEAAQTAPAPVSPETASTPAAASTDPNSQPDSDAASASDPVNPDSQPNPEPQSAEVDQAQSPELQKMLGTLEELHEKGILTDAFYEKAKGRIDAAQETISELDYAHRASRQILAANRKTTLEPAIEHEMDTVIKRSIDAELGRQAEIEEANEAAPDETEGSTILHEPLASARKLDADEGRRPRELHEKAKRRRGFRRAIDTVVKAGLTAALVTAIGIASAVGLADRALADDAGGKVPVAADTEYDSYNAWSADRNRDSAETAEQLGIQDGYDKTGMWTSETKPGPYAFASASEVAQECNNDEREMLKYTAHNQVESMADYVANLPEAVQPKQFRGKTILESEAILENMSDEEFSIFEKVFQGKIDQAFTRRIIVNGNYDNAYMRLIDETKPATHDNMELVRCTTTESNLEVTEFYWLDKDGNEIGAMQVKLIPIYDAEGRIVGYEGCAQVIKKEGSKTHSDLRSVPNNPSDPGNPNPGTGAEGTGVEGTEGTGVEGAGDEGTGSAGAETTEWGKSGDPHGGDLVDVSGLVDPNSEVTQEQNDATNQGNQGYIDDNHAQPGSPSENNGTGDNGFSQIIADGADTDGGRLSGGESQDTSGINGTNAYTPSSQDIQRDNVGNDAQAAAQTGGGESGTGAVAGGDNFSDVAEEQAIANGGF